MLHKTLLIGLCVSTPRRAGLHGTQWCGIEDVSEDGQKVLLTGGKAWKCERRWVPVHDVQGYTEKARKKLAAWIAERTAAPTEPIAFLTIPTADEPGRRKIIL